MERSKLRKALVSSFLLLILIIFPSSVLAKTTVAVMPFEGSEVRDWYIDREQMIKGITESLTDRLANTDNISIVERTRLEHIMREQDFGYSGRVDPFSAAEIGKLLGADLLILGTVHSLELKESGGIQFGPFAAKGTSGKVELSIRVVNVTTGVVLGSVRGSGSKTGASLGVNNLYGVSFFSDTFKDSVLGKAMDEAVEELVTKFSDELLTKFLEESNGQGAAELNGNILAVVGENYIVNLGLPHNVVRGDRFEVFEVVRVPGLSKPVEVPVGFLRVISVDDEAFVAISEEGEFEVGHVVKKK